MSALRLDRGGPWVSIQDLGRRGLQRYGVSEAGAVDPVSLRVANRLAGNADGVPAIEIGPLGATFSLDAATLTIGVAGPDVQWQVDDEPMTPNRARTIEPSAVVTVRPGRGAAYAYLAAAGGIAVPTVFGSASFHARSGLGGLDGRALAPGDLLPVNPSTTAELVLASPIPHAGMSPEFRVVPGPQLGNFTPDAVDALCDGPYRIGAKSDRMGVRLEGRRLSHSELGYNIVSDGIALGSIQVPGNGQPIVLGADRQTTGGYPKLAVIARADMFRFLQCPPGTEVRFRPIDVDAATIALRDLRGRLDRMVFQPVRPAMSSERLLSLNLIDGVVG